MLKTYLVVLFLGHIIGDFYFQTSKMAENKATSPKSFIRHCLLYAISIVLVCLPIWSNKLIPIIFILSTSHLLIDCIKVLLIKNRIMTSSSGRYNKDTKLFLGDQLLHIITIFASAIYMTKHFSVHQFQPVFVEFFDLFAIDIDYAMDIALLFLINAKPYNIFIKKLLNKDVIVSNTSASVKGVGASIGSLERWIIIIFFLMKQYSSIGLVLTAKSIARYNKISENESFAEYYLLGTLISTILAVVSTILII